MISCEPHEIADLALGIAAVVFVPQIIGVDFADVASVFNQHVGMPATQGRGFVKHGPINSRTATLVRQRLRALAAEGFDGNVFIHCFIRSCATSTSLQSLDDFYTSALADRCVWKNEYAATIHDDCEMVAVYASMKYFEETTPEIN